MNRKMLNVIFKENKQYLFLLILFCVFMLGYVLMANVVIAFYYKRIIDELVNNDFYAIMKYTVYFFIAHSCSMLLFSINKWLENLSIHKIERNLRIFFRKANRQTKLKIINNTVERISSTIKIFIEDICVNFVLLFLIINIILFNYDPILNFYFIIWSIIYILFLNIVHTNFVKYDCNICNTNDIELISNDILITKKRNYKNLLIINNSKDLSFLLLNINIIIHCLNLFLLQILSIPEFCFVIQLVFNFQAVNRSINDKYIILKNNIKIINKF